MDNVEELKKLPRRTAWSPIGSRHSVGLLNTGNEQASPGAAVGVADLDLETSQHASASRRMKRKLSWMLTAVAYLVPTLWAYCANSALAEEHGIHGYGRDYLIVGMDNFLRAWIASAFLSFLALGFSLAALSLVPGPRAKLRILETIGISLPFVGLVVAVVAAAAAGR